MRSLVLPVLVRRLYLEMPPGKGGRKAGQNGNLHPRTGRDLKYADVTIWFVDAETIAVTSYERNYNSFHKKRRVKVS